MPKWPLLALPIVALIVGGSVVGVNYQHQQQVEYQQRVTHAAEVKHAAEIKQALAEAAKATRQERGGTDHLQDPAANSDPTQSKAKPTRLLIPAIGVNTNLEKLTQDSRGVLNAPHYADEAGWFAKGVVPGQQGPAVLVGHVDTIQGPAVFAKLDQLKPGNRLIIVMSDGKRFTYRMDGSDTVKKALFPSKEVYGPTPDAQLRVITCSEPFDYSSHTYTNNLVLFATLVS